MFAVFINTLNEKRTVPAWPPSPLARALRPLRPAPGHPGPATPSDIGHHTLMLLTGSQGPGPVSPWPQERDRKPRRGKQLPHGEGKASCFPIWLKAAHGNRAAPFPRN